MRSTHRAATPVKAALIALSALVYAGAILLLFGRRWVMLLKRG